MKSYFLFDGKKKLGPLKLDDIKGLDVTDKYMVWTEGLTDWKNIEELDELKLFIKKAPVLPPLLPQEIDAYKKAENERKAFNISIIVSLLTFFTIAVVVFSSLGGFLSNRELRDLSYDYGSASNMTIEELRIAIATISLLFVSFPLSLLTFYFPYQVVKTVDDKLRLRKVSSAYSALFFGLVITIVLMLIVFILNNVFGDGKISLEFPLYFKYAWVFIPGALMILSIILYPLCLKHQFNEKWVVDRES